jgi:hypothetical protein
MMGASALSMGNSFNSLKFLLMLFIIVFALVGGTEISHAIQRHKEEAVIARTCIDQQGVDFIYRKWDDRIAVQLCFIQPDGNGNFSKLAIRVLVKVGSKLEEITAYTDANITTLEKAVAFIDEEINTYGYISWIKPCWRTLITPFLK